MDDPEKDPNVVAYHKMLENPEFRVENHDKWVIFVDGVLVAVDEDRSRALESGRLQHPNKDRFFAQVGAQERVIDMPSILAVHR